MEIQRKLKRINIGGWEELQSEDLGYGPYFTNEISYRMHRQYANNIIFTGEAGVGKSYTAWDVARLITNKFMVEDIVSTYTEYMEQLLKKHREHVPIGFDEPQYALDKRDWYNQINKALIKTMTSQRFRLRPIFIPIINLSMLDKVLRSYLIQFHVILNDRGIGYSYRLIPSQIEDKLYRYRICKIEFGLFDSDLCDKPSCLTCGELKTCPIFRAQYERKKASWQLERDEGQLEESRNRDREQIMTDEIMVNCVIDNVDLCRNPKNNSIDPNRIVALIREKLKFRIGKSRGYEIRGQVYFKKPEWAPQIIDKE